METLGEWLVEQLDQRGWSQAELGRRAHIGNATLSRIIAGTRQIGPDVAQSIARALRVPPEDIYRLAGLLPQIPPNSELSPTALAELDQIRAIVAGLPRDVQDELTTQLLELARRAGRWLGGNSGENAA